MRWLALLAAVLAAAVLPYSRLGIGVPLVAAIVALAVATSARRSAVLISFGGLALALACTPAWLDASWIVAIDLGAACLLATAAVAGVSLAAPAAPVRALVDAPPLLPSVGREWVPAARGALLGSLLVVPFGALFWSADAAFAELGGSVPLPSFASAPGRVVVFLGVLVGAVGLALAERRSSPRTTLPNLAKLGRLEWTIPLALLDLLFLAFVVVQATVLFGGHTHVLETAGLTYSEYAHQGFWQLIAAAALTLVVVETSLRVAVVRTRAERAVLHGLVGCLCILTLVIVASAIRRLHLYEDAFGLTRARLAAETFSLAVGALFALVIVAGIVPAVRARFAAIAVAGGALGLLAFSLSNPDGRVAAHNVERWREGGNLDVAYAQGLSADAVPALARLPEPLRGRVLAPYRRRLAEGEPWSSANRSRRHARAILAADNAPSAGRVSSVATGTRTARDLGRRPA
jgi:Domain of unknown function (DUF4173)